MTIKIDVVCCKGAVKGTQLYIIPLFIAYNISTAQRHDRPIPIGRSEDVTIMSVSIHSQNPVYHLTHVIALPIRVAVDIPSARRTPVPRPLVTILYL